MATAATTRTRRTASREERRRQLIDATMKCIASKGLSNTSIGDVAKEAGLSQGIVNLHFESKDNLLKETLVTLADAGMQCFDVASTIEMQMVRAASSAACFHYHNPVKSRAEIARAHHEFGCRRYAAAFSSAIRPSG